VFTEDELVISSGNFHAAFPAMASDSLALAMSYLCNISERRVERMMNRSLNGFLPDFLVENTGVNSGFMIVQYASAAITAENRALASPGSVHSIPTCNGQEDIVSMGAYSARKAIISIENTYKVLGYELFTACQALDFTKEKPGKYVAELHDKVREFVPNIEIDIYMAEYINQIIEMLHHHHV
ncbi:MAG: aromatic amino acid lyase, partial [Nitrososphaeraceae archaeon]|nr:aromatic amino acid lyase [Nitrososphaeraceae archaeon]